MVLLAHVLLLLLLLLCPLLLVVALLLVRRSVLLDALLHRRELVVFLFVVAGNDQMMHRRVLLLLVPRLNVEVRLRVDLLDVQERRRIDNQRVRPGLLGPRWHDGHLTSTLGPGNVRLNGRIR